MLRLTPDPPDHLPPSAEIRHTFIGGSEAYELLNERQYGKGCVRALGYRKTETPQDIDERAARGVTIKGILQRGHLLEDVIAQLYMRDTGRLLVRRNRLVRNPEYPGAGVHTDRIILADAMTDRPTGDAELKSHGEGPFLNILRNGLPPGHNLQLQWSLFCTSHTWGAFIILGVFGELPLTHFDVVRDDDVIEIFKRETDKFWNVLARGELPPPPFPADDVRCRICPWRLTCRGEHLDPEELARVLAEKNDKTPLATIRNDELDELLMNRALIQGEMEALDNESEDEPGALQIVNAQIKELMGDTEAGLVNGRWRVYCRPNTWNGLDVQRMKQEAPDTYKKFYISRPTGKKRLNVYPVNR
jgi:predicted phage-related endonuclease